MHFEVPMQKNVSKMVFKAKQKTTKLPVMFLNGKVLKYKDSNYVFEVVQPRRKVQCMDLAFENLKIRSKKPQQ